MIYAFIYSCQNWTGAQQTPNRGLFSNWLHQMIQQQCIPTDACVPTARWCCQPGHVSFLQPPSSDLQHTIRSALLWSAGGGKDTKMCCFLLSAQRNSKNKSCKLSVRVTSASISQRYSWKVDSQNYIISINMEFKMYYSSAFWKGTAWKLKKLLESNNSWIETKAWNLQSSECLLQFPLH